MVVLCQDGVRGVIESAFAALDEVYVLRHDSNQSLKMSTNQIAFLGEWSDSVEIINSVEVPPDVEAILGLEQLEQLRELAGKAPVHLESLPQEGSRGALAQLVIGPSSAKAVKEAVDTIVSHVDGLDYPPNSYAKAASESNAAVVANDSLDPASAGDQWIPPAASLPQTSSGLYPPGSPPMMMVCPVWPGSSPAWSDWPATSTWGSSAATGAALPAEENLLAPWAGQPQTVEVPIDTEQTPVQEIPLRLESGPAKEERPGAAPPWRNKELPPPPQKKHAPEKKPLEKTEVSAGTTVKRYRPSSLAGKRRREAMTVKQEVDEDEASGLKTAEDSRAPQGVAPESPTNSAQDEANKTVLFWATQQDQFSNLPQLPDGWIRIPSKSAGIYYVNLATGRSTFRSPLELPPGWTKVMSKSTGREYYWHAEKQISQFDWPTD
ncbi:unnamed protein product [Symbiodinium natans]|uniref:WW domain-containing protein n=1 Tax=Symbiodinium natans TaxID=878477 RepID=A0A812JU25_9DINO|nr:unnamed protein product [Symbiodinium natans]